jgi:thymidylate synthase
MESIMIHEEYQYLSLMERIIKNGIRKDNRTGIPVYSLFSQSLSFSLENNSLPLFTTKKMYARGIIEELLSFIKGDTNTKHLEEKNVNIWKGNTSREYLDKVGLNYLPEGEMGCGYAHQWRNFGGEHPLVPETKGLKGFDQVKFVYDTLKSNPLDRRMIINAWCPNQSKYMALPPCHLIYIFYYDPNSNELSCHLTQRSCDTFLGVPFNIASLALLTHIMAKSAEMKAGKIHWLGVDVHLYENHIEQAKTQISRVPYNFPQIKINKDINSFEDLISLEYKDFELVNYVSHDALKADMAV